MQHPVVLVGLIWLVQCDRSIGIEIPKFKSYLLGKFTYFGFPKQGQYPLYGVAVRIGIHADNE